MKLYNEKNISFNYTFLQTHLFLNDAKYSGEWIIDFGTP